MNVNYPVCISLQALTAMDEGGGGLGGLSSLVSKVTFFCQILTLQQSKINQGIRC